MPIFQDYFNDAPLTDTQPAADLTDVYLYVDTPEDTPAKGDAIDISLGLDLMAEEQATDTSDSGFRLETDLDDVFVFLSGIPGSETAVPDPSMPSPQEPKPKSYSELEAEKLNGARHNAFGAMLQHWLVYG